MQASILLNNKIYEIKKKIRLLEWDISIINSKDLKDVKEKELNKCKVELEKLETLSNKRITEIPQKTLRRWEHE